MRKVTVPRMRERYAQTVLTFRITYVHVTQRTQLCVCCVIPGNVHTKCRFRLNLTFTTLRHLFIYKRNLRVLPTELFNDILCNIIIKLSIIVPKSSVAQSVEALRNKPEGRGFDSDCVHWGFFYLLYILSVAVMVWDRLSL